MAEAEEGGSGGTIPPLAVCPCPDPGSGASFCPGVIPCPSCLRPSSSSRPRPSPTTFPTTLIGENKEERGATVVVVASFAGSCTIFTAPGIALVTVFAAGLALVTMLTSNTSDVTSGGGGGITEVAVGPGPGVETVVSLSIMAVLLLLLVMLGWSCKQDQWEGLDRDSWRRPALMNSCPVSAANLLIACESARQGKRGRVW